MGVIIATGYYNILAEKSLDSKKPVIGIMGAIASGKSFVSSVFGEFGMAVIDADAIVRGLYNDKNFVDSRLVPIFGEKIFDSQGNLDRVYISTTVFNDPQKLKELNDAVHPAVGEVMKTQMNQYMQNAGFKGIVLDVPLLLEVGSDKWCDYLVFVDSQSSLCAQRAKKRSKITEKELENRQKSQISLDIKRKIANYIIYNNSDMSVIKRQVNDVISDIFHNFMKNIS